MPADPATVEAVELLRLVEVEHRAGRFDGVALVARGDLVLLKTAVGLANRAFDQPHTVGEPMPIASVTKQLLAISVLQLIEEQRIALDDPVGKHLPWITQPWGATVTIRALLTHHSGLRQPEEVVPNFYFRPDLETSAAALAKLVAAAPAATPPDGAFSYNNADYILLSAVVETVRGRALAYVLRNHIFQKAGMRDAGLITGREIIPKLPANYDLDDPTLAPRLAPQAELANFSGAGAAYATANDLWSLDRALMGHALLRPDTTDVMLASSPQSGYGAMGVWSYPIDIAGTRFARVVERHGSIYGYNVVNLYVPEAGLCVILMCNVSSFEEPQTWMRKGLAYRLLDVCASPRWASRQKR